MLLDGAVALLLLLANVGGAWPNIVLAMLSFILTSLLFVPMHNQVSKSVSPILLEKLVRQNLWRVFLWGAKLFFGFKILGDHS
jgi:hypothetical protein